MDKQQRG